MTAPAFRLLVGDVLQQLATLPDESVHCVVTSPPYWGLRDYGVEGQLGLERTPELYVAAMVAVFREVRRVLRSDGTLWLNLGDSYAADRSYQVSQTRGAKAHDFGKSNATKVPAGLKPKDLVGIPWRLAFALQADGWWLRSEIIWAKPNPMPESVTDRPTKAHEQVFLLTKSARYFYDADAVREPHDFPNQSRTSPGLARREATQPGNTLQVRPGHEPTNHPAGRNLRSVWTIPTEPYPDAHFATYPTRLVEPCVKAGTSEYGCCPECGAPWERSFAEERTKIGKSRGGNYRGREDDADGSMQNRMASKGDTFEPGMRFHRDFLGWKPSCICGPVHCIEGKEATLLLPRSFGPVPCTVLDPFLGSGTTAAVALALGRNAIGIELNPDYADLARKRVNAWGPKRMRLAQISMEGVA